VGEDSKVLLGFFPRTVTQENSSVGRFFKVSKRKDSCVRRKWDQKKNFGVTFTITGTWASIGEGGQGRQGGVIVELLRQKCFEGA